MIALSLSDEARSGAGGKREGGRRVKKSEYPFRS